MMPVRNCFRAVSAIILAWWRSDSIRISPTEGRLLQLRTGNRFIVNGELYTIGETIQRYDAGRLTGRQIEILTPCKTGVLEVSVCAAAGTASAQLRFDGKVTTVFDDDVTLIKSENVRLSPSEGL